MLVLQSTILVVGSAENGEPIRAWQ